MGECEIYDELMRQWKDVCRQFTAAVQLLCSKRAILSKEEFDLLRAEAENARIASDNACLAVDRHCLDHECGYSRARL